MLMGANRDEKVFGPYGAIGRVQFKLARSVAGGDPVYLHPLAVRRIETRSKAFDIRYDLFPMHEPAGVIPIIRKPGKQAEFVRRNEVEVVPAVSPGIANATAVEHDVLAPSTL